MVDPEELSRLSRVPPGRHQLPREFVAEHQRKRIRAATAELVAKRGYRNTTVANIVKEAGVARHTFYEHYADKEECFLATLDDGFERAAERARAAADGVGGPWAEKVQAGLAALLAFVAEEPSLARTCLVESMTAGPEAMERYEQAIALLFPFMREGRKQSPQAEKLPETMEETLVGGLAWIVYQRLVMGEVEELEGLLPEMLEFALTPYLGEAEAKRSAGALSAAS